MPDDPSTHSSDSGSPRVSRGATSSGQASSAQAPPPPVPQVKTGEEFLRLVLESLIEDRDKLKIEENRDDLGTLCTVQVSSRDMGKLIGKNGQTVSALRTLLRVLGGMRNERLNLKVLEPVD